MNKAILIFILSFSGFARSEGEGDLPIVYANKVEGEPTKLRKNKLGGSDDPAESDKGRSKCTDASKKLNSLDFIGKVADQVLKKKLVMKISPFEEADIFYTQDGAIVKSSRILMPRIPHKA